LREDGLLNVTAKKHRPEYIVQRGHREPASRLIAVGGGKGGVGKSFISSSLAIFLSQMGYKTVLMDLDLGGANLHTYLGQGLPEVGINEFLANPNLKLEQVAKKTFFKNLFLISGASENYDSVELSKVQKSRLMSEIFKMKADFVIMDLSAGTHALTLDLFLMAQEKVVVMTPEPVSIENAYRFIKSCFYRRIRRFEYQLNLQEELKEIMRNRKRIGIRTPGDLLHYVQSNYPEAGEDLSDLMHKLSLNIVLNQGRTQNDMKLAPSIRSVCNKYFGINCELLGEIEYDNAVWQSLRQKKHLLVESPHSRLYTQLMKVARQLAKRHKRRIAA
jgi:flagellar biosynthesis protein FlhG